MACDQCQLVRINGLVCHEIGCPVSWRDEVRECRECGCSFQPESLRQQCCDEECAAAYSGAPFGWESV